MVGVGMGMGMQRSDPHPHPHGIHTHDPRGYAIPMQLPIDNMTHSITSNCQKASLDGLTLPTRVNDPHLHRSALAVLGDKCSVLLVKVPLTGLVKK